MQSLCMNSSPPANPAGLEFEKGLAHAYFRWDNFVWNEALGILLNYRNDTLLVSYKIKRTVLQNIRFLHELAHTSPAGHIITDLYQNAMRRADEKRYSDAIIRLNRINSVLTSSFKTAVNEKTGEITNLCANNILISGNKTGDKHRFEVIQRKVLGLCRENVPEFDKLREYSRFPELNGKTLFK